MHSSPDAIKSINPWQPRSLFSLRRDKTVYDNLPEDYRNKLMKAIVAFEVEVASIDNVFKLSQNRDKESYQHIVEKLRSGDQDGKTIAGEMEKRKKDLFQ